VFEDPQIQAQNMVIEVEQPGHGLVRMLGFPMKFSATPCTVRRPAPGLGQHSDEVLAELGFTEGQCRAFRDTGVI
jgi:CoA:oxalate CoA-transferase